jgi:hypothetical protein
VLEVIYYLRFYELSFQSISPTINKNDFTKLDFIDYLIIMFNIVEDNRIVKINKLTNNGHNSQTVYLSVL